MSNSVRLSKEHGVNPTIPICFWCGKEKNEVVLLGKLKNDKEAPMKTWIPGDYEPCDNCKELRKQGIDFIEVSETPVIYDDQPEFCGAYPTSRHMIIKDAAVKRLFDGSDILDEILEKRAGFVDKETFEYLNSMIEGE